MHTEPSEICPRATTSVTPDNSSFYDSGALSDWKALPAPINLDAIGASDWNLLFANLGDEVTRERSQSDFNALNIDTPNDFFLSVYATSDADNLWCQLHADV